MINIRRIFDIIVIDASTIIEIKNLQWCDIIRSILVDVKKLCTLTLSRCFSTFFIFFWQTVQAFDLILMLLDQCALENEPNVSRAVSPEDNSFSIIRFWHILH